MMELGVTYVCVPFLVLEREERCEESVESVEEEEQR